MTIEKRHIVLLIDYLTFAGIEYVVSPYEADAQLAYMHKIGQIDYVVTEDSDLVLYDCGNIVNKLNQSGYCELLQVKNDNLLYNNSDTEEVEDFIRLSQEQKIWMSLMVGCDYLEKVRGVGLKKGIDLIQNIASLKELFTRLKEKCKRFNNTTAYKNAFKNCELVFKFQKVYNPLTQKLCYFQKPDEHMLKYMKTISNLEDYVGSDISNLKKHIIGDNIRNQVPKEERLLFDFKSLEYKVHHQKYKYQMNQISNLVSFDPNNAVISKDDIKTHFINKDNFYNQNKTGVSLLKKVPQEKSKSKRIGRFSRRINGKIPRNKLRNSRRVRSSDLPCEDSCPVEIDSLKKDFTKTGKKYQKKLANRTKKWREKEVIKQNKDMLQDILDASLNPVCIKPSKSNVSTKIESKLNSLSLLPKSKQKNFGKPQKKSRRNITKKTKFNMREMDPSSKIIGVGDLLEAEKTKEKNVNLSVNIGYQMLHLKNDEKKSKLKIRNKKVLYSKDAVIRKKKLKKSKISKYSQNIIDSERLIEEFIFSPSEEKFESFVSKRSSKRIKKNFLKKNSMIKRIKEV